jgi:hypothetical protein
MVTAGGYFSLTEFLGSLMKDFKYAHCAQSWWSLFEITQDKIKVSDVGYVAQSVNVTNDYVRLSFEQWKSPIYKYLITKEHLLSLFKIAKEQ